MKKTIRFRNIVIFALILLALAGAVFASVSVQISHTNMTIFDSSEIRNVFETTTTFIYSNYTNATSNTTIANANCSLYLDSDTVRNMNYNSSTELYEYGLFIVVGNHTYNISCNKTGYAHLNASNNITIPNRNPQIVQSIPNINFAEDNFTSFNISPYFSEPDSLSQTLVWNYTPVNNLTISINNNSGMMNITPDTNYYGVRNITITAIDNLNATNSTNVTITVENRPEVNITSPLNGASGYYTDDTIIFRAKVSDDYSFENCNLIFDGTINKTNTSYVPHNATEIEMKDDDGTRESSKEIVKQSGSSTKVLNLTKQINITNTPHKIKIYTRENDPLSAGPMATYKIYVNGNNIFNITSGQITENTYSWFSQDVSSNNFVMNTVNNITIIPHNTAVSYMEVGLDTGTTNIQRSFYNSTFQETGEYMIRVTYDPNEVKINLTNITKGNHTWNIECTNNQSQTSKSLTDFNITINDSLPTRPTNIYCNGGSCLGGVSTSTGIVNISCTGSIDNDGDNFNYTLKYIDNNSNSHDLTIFNGTNYEWDFSALHVSELNLTLRCAPKSNPSKIKESGYFVIELTGAPIINNSEIKCNGGSCTDSIFTTDILNITCNATDPNNDVLNYSVIAQYIDINGIANHTLTDSYTQDASNIINWDTTNIINQTNVSFFCRVTDEIWEIDSNIFNNITLLKQNAPTKPLINTTSNSTTVKINCTGSTGSGTIEYNIWAKFKTAKYKNLEWSNLGETNATNVNHYWNITQLYEQEIKFKCQANNGTYYSEFSNSSNETISHPPSNPTLIEINQEIIHEYNANYFCDGSKNTEKFNYTIQAYYNDSSSFAWRTLTTNFPGIIEFDNATQIEKISYDDENALNTQYYNQPTLEINISNGNYTFCAKAKGTDIFSIHYNCNSTFKECSNKALGTLSNSYEYYCTNITLNKPGEKYLKLFFADNAYLDITNITHIPFSWNITNIPVQRNVQFKCKAVDTQGSSSWIYSSNITIDRIPDFNSTNFTTSYNWDYGSTSAININLSKHFTDQDGQTLNYSVSGNSNFNVIINQTTSITEITPSSNTLDEVSETIQFTANDSIATENSSEITLSTESKPNSGGGGSSGYTQEEAEEAGMDTSSLTTVSDNLETEEKSTTTEPEKQQPIETGGSSNKQTNVIQSVFDTKVKHTRKFFVSGDKTRIVEKIKNIGFYELEDVIIKVTIPKEIEKSASKIIQITEFTIIEEDPVIGFYLPYLNLGNTEEISYIINKPLRESDIEKITIEIIPKNLTEKEIKKLEDELQEKIETTEKFINVTTTAKSNFEKGETEFNIDLNVQEGVILYNISIFAEIPKCLIEILKEEMIESDIEFEIINEDPLIRWHFDSLSANDEINYLIKQVADENCTNQISVRPLAHRILLLTAKFNLRNAIIPLLLIPLIIFTITFFSAYGYEQKEKVSKLKHVIKWARQKKKAGFKEEIIIKFLKQKKYAKKTIEDIMKFSANLPKLIFTRLEVDAEEAIVIILILLNVFDFLKLLPGEIAFAKVIISWTILGYVLFKASITKILFGNRSKKVDFILLFAYFMLVMKNLSKIAETEFLEAGLMKDMYILIANNAYVFDSLFFMIGISIVILMSFYIAWKIPVSRKSFLGALGEFGKIRSVFNFTTRTILIFLTQAFFFIVVFNLVMEWLALAVDASLLTAAMIFYLFVLIKHRQKHWLVKTIYKIGNIGEKFYEKFVELFHNRKTIFIGLTGMLTLHTLTEIGIFIIPYVLGIYNPIYFTSWEAGHTPIFNIFGWLRGLIGIKTGSTSSLFIEGIAGLGFTHGVAIFFVYVLNIIAIIFLLTIHAVVWYHLYRYRKLPISKVPKMIFSKLIISIFASSFTAFIIAGAFKIKGLYFRGLMGVDILTINIANNPNIELVLAISIAIGLVVYLLMYLMPKTKIIFNWMVIALSFGFFFRYIFLFFTSVITFYVSTIATLTNTNIFITIILLIFMTMTILFYGIGILGLLFELWLRNELGLRTIFRIKELPEWMKYFDMSYIHHEKSHETKKHGKKFELLKNYILQEMQRNHKFSTILLHLLRVGWSEKVIEDALHELKENEEFIKCLTKDKHKSSKNIANLAVYIEKEFKKGIHLKKIISLIKKKGWTDTDLVDALLIIRIS